MEFKKFSKLSFNKLFLLLYYKIIIFLYYESENSFTALIFALRMLNYLKLF
jgi:hypothetical protein